MCSHLCHVSCARRGPRGENTEQEGAVSGSGGVMARPLDCEAQSVIALPSQA